MNKSQRIWLNSENTNDDKYIFVKLEQDVDTFEIMSLKLDSKGVYQNFNSDFGVLVGRVIANNGIGIPNAKVSIFIPLLNEDQNNSDIISIYPYTSPRIKNNQGKRYNLLPRVAKINPETGESSPKQSFGSFPIKEEILTNETLLEVYEKYYKFSTITNEAGDYMIYGVPVGTQTVHMSVDITDIGEFSMNPAAMVTNLGYSPNLFTDNNTRIKESNNLEDLPHIETQEVSVDVIPFWGDVENFEIGITRQDFRIRAELINTFLVFGSGFTDGDDHMWGENNISGDQAGELYRARNGVYNLSDKRTGEITEKIYYYPPKITDVDLFYGYFNPFDDAEYLDPSTYSTYKRNGDFVYIINCNRKKIITSETGEKITVDDDYVGGIYTEFVGFFTFEITSDTLPMNFSGSLGGDVQIEPMRYRFKFPQKASIGETFSKDSEEYKEDWVKENFKFIGGTYYSVARYHGQVHIHDGADNAKNKNFEVGQFDSSVGFFKVDRLDSFNRDPNWCVGVIKTNGDENIEYGMISNWNEGGENFFGGNWLNFSIYFPQMGKVRKNAADIERMRINTHFTVNTRDLHYLNDNSDEFAAGQINTKEFARSDIHHTIFIKTSKGDINKMLSSIGNLKGFRDDNIFIFNSLNGEYMNGRKQLPLKYNGALFGNSGKVNLETNQMFDERYYFYRGFGDSDCFQFLSDLGLLI
jgi:hypothetical protein